MKKWNGDYMLIIIGWILVAMLVIVGLFGTAFSNHADKVGVWRAWLDVFIGVAATVGGLAALYIKYLG